MTERSPPPFTGEPLDWIPDVFRSMTYTDEAGVTYRLDYSNDPNGEWVPMPPRAEKPGQLRLDMSEGDSHE